MQGMRHQVTFRVRLAEAAGDAGQDGLYEGIIIREGQSANGVVYTRAALETGIEIFKGALMFRDHPGMFDPPARSVADVVGRVEEVELREDADGAYLFGRFYVSKAEEELRTKIREGVLGDLSIHAWAEVEEKDNVTTVKAFLPDPFTSVDFVTIGAAGGEITKVPEDMRESVVAALIESVGADVLRQRLELQEVMQVDNGTETQVQELQAQLQEVTAERDQLREENAQLFKQLRTLQAERVVERVLSGVEGLPDAAIERVRAQVKPLTEAFTVHGNQDTEAQLEEAVQAVVNAEREYVAKIAPALTITAGAATNQVAEGAQAAGGLEDALAELFATLGYSDQEVQVLVGK